MKISKSKQELARIISEHGGWRDGAGFSVMDSNGKVFGFLGAPKWSRVLREWTGCDCSFMFRSAAPTPNYQRTILSRAEYFHLYPAQDADGWIEWGGGECPVDEYCMVDYRMSATPYGYHLTNQARNLAWGRVEKPYCIIAYRLHKPERAEPESCESVMRSIPEPEAKPTIEQLAADYRSANDFALRLQEEANNAWNAAEKAKAELIDAGKAIGLLVSPITAKQEPGLVITDWRDLRVGDIVWVDAYDDHDEGEWPVKQMEDASYGCDYAFSVKNGDSCERWIDSTMPWRFIRRP